MKPVLALLAVAIPLLSQTTVKDAMIKHWKVTGDFTIAVAEAMPAENYTYRPSPEEMTYGQLMAHIVGADMGACASASGMVRPALPEKIAVWAKAQDKTDVDKESAVLWAKQIFAFCNTAVASMTAERFDTVQGAAARNLTGFEWLWSYFTHTAHHRGQAEVYLRLKGIKPPTYQF